MLTNPFSPGGRLTRTRYAIAIALLAGTLFVVRTVAVGPAPATMAAAIIITIALSIPWFCVTAQRLHDFSREDTLAIVSMGLVLGFGAFSTLARTTSGSAGSWADAIAGFFGVSAVISAIAIGSKRNTTGPNRFGGDPRDGYAPEKAPAPQEMTPEDLEEHPTVLSTTGVLNT
jgi:uncharacterized membrane protein YhaH (DUF805 family)